MPVWLLAGLYRRFPSFRGRAEDRGAVTGKGDANNLIVRVWECMTCSGLPNTGQLLCHFESGLIAGGLETILGRRARSTQTKGVSNSDPYCQFEVFLF